MNRGIKGQKLISSNWKSNDNHYGSLNNPPPRNKFKTYFHSKLCNFLESPFRPNAQDFNLDFISLTAFYDCE